MKRNLIWIVGVFVGSFVVHTGHAMGQTPVRVAPAKVETIQQRHAVTGSLRAVARGNVAALESGRLVQLTVREGDRVDKGETLAKVDDRRLRAEKSAAEADLRVAQAELSRRRAEAEQASANLVRGENLVEQNAISRQELDQYRAESKVAIAEIEAAERRIERVTEAIRLLDIRIADATVKAPYDASVVARHAEPGDWVQPGDHLVTLVSRGPLEAWLEVPERFAAALQNDSASVVVRASALDRDLQVLRTKRLNDVNTRVRTIQLIATVENAGNMLAAGMSIEGFVPSGTEGDFLTVPKDAVVRRSGQAAVFIVDQEKVARQIAVRVLFETPDRVAVSAQGLLHGSQVIVEGNERLMPSQLVQVVSPKAGLKASIANR